MTKTETVLSKLKRRPVRGITPLDFPKGFRLGARIHDLRCKGHDILTIDSGVGKLARYRLAG
ncbi:MAG: hypothetical protein DBP02_02025 [gamma proteobacterium symbiont of Ctena orbiculata]|nr:MAG: hypothetical protein DBP02_02025 [gamma proteobacterium symbiont of Ctena orbiculata]